MRLLFALVLFASCGCGSDPVPGPEEDTYVPCVDDAQCQDDGRFPDYVCEQGRCVEHPQPLSPMGN